MNLLSIAETKSLIADGALIIDTRPTALFVQGFIPRSLHLPDNADLSGYAEQIHFDDMKLILVADPDRESTMAHYLIKRGFTNLSGILQGGYEKWIKSGGNRDIIIDISAEEFELDFSFDEFYLIDLRENEQYEEEHFEYAENVPLSDLEETIPDLNPDMTYYLYGNSFEDAAVAAALFRRNGFYKLRAVNEGYEAIRKSNIPVIKKKTPKADTKFSAN